MEKLYVKYLKEYGYEEKFQIEKREFKISISFKKLRDILIRLGHVLEENVEEQIYVVSIKAGLLGINNAIIICKMDTGKLILVGFAREGVIKQHTCERAMDKIEERCNAK